MRKQLLKYDDVMNDQRKAIFEQRFEIMEGEDMSDVVKDMRDQVIDDLVDTHIPAKAYADQWNTEALYGEVIQYLDIDVPVIEWADEEGIDDADIRARLYEAADKSMAKKAVEFGVKNFRDIEKHVLLQTIDKKWRDHIVTLEHLRSVVGFRGYAQRDPLNEFKSEGFELFQSLLDGLRTDVTMQLCRARMPTEEEKRAAIIQMQAQAMIDINEKPDNGGRNDTAILFDENDPETWGRPGRNDPCPCGQGRKFKHCHGRL